MNAFTFWACQITQLSYRHPLKSLLSFNQSIFKRFFNNTCLALISYCYSIYIVWECCVKYIILDSPPPPYFLSYDNITYRELRQNRILKRKSLSRHHAYSLLFRCIFFVLGLLCVKFCQCSRIAEASEYYTSVNKAKQQQ